MCQKAKDKMWKHEAQPTDKYYEEDSKHSKERYHLSEILPCKEIGILRLTNVVQYI